MFISKLRSWIRLWLCALAGVSVAFAALQPDQVAILVNKDTPISAEVAQMYQRAREIPSAHVLTLSLGVDRQITPEQYWKAAPFIKLYLEAHPEIRCILTTSGVPYTVQAAEADAKDDGAAFDSELAGILREQPGDRKRNQQNPLYLAGGNAYGISDPRQLQMVFVARLDGPDLKTMTRMVEDAIAVEKTGLAGPIFGDAQGLDGVTAYAYGDATIRSAIDRLSGAGFEATLDMKQESWKQPKDGVGEQAAGAAFYVGWYDYLNFQDIFGAQGLAKGAIAWHLASGECQDLWHPGGGWCANLIRRGAAVTIGPVREPYITAFPHGDIFTEALLSGGTVAESYWLAIPQFSWEMVVLGDPLYRPFALNPRPSLVARAYIADNPKHILEHGQTSPLSVILECIGPAGSGTPAMTATAEAEMGLSAASGSITIPALKAGQSVIVRVPSVTAGAAPNGMFRLRLNAQDEQKQSRRIVLEGRTGFSRLSTGLLLKSQMFVNSRGDALIAGKPGGSMLIDTDSLSSQNFSPAKDLVVTGAEFSPDDQRIALQLLEPKDKKTGTVLADRKLGTTQPVAGATPFVRWLGNNEILLNGGDKMIRHSLTGGEDHIFPRPEGWSGPLAGGNVIPGTDVQYLVSTDGRIVIQNGAQPAHEVLEGTKATKFAAVANDLSLVGGVDSDKRFWVQHGLDGKPEIAATGVEAIVWGPISRRAVVVGANARSRAYDGRDGSWIDLGVIAGAQWSADEEQLLFVAEGYLSILTGGRIEKLCDMNRIGRIVRLAISSSGDKAFLLAGLGGGLDVWTMALPPRVRATK